VDPTVRVLVPECRQEPLDQLYADLQFPQAAHRPYLYVNMVATADGAAHLSGRTKGMGGEADRLAFRRLRESCDVVLVGAGTVRAEGYGPPRLDAEAQARRRRRGLEPLPRLAVVSARLQLDPALRVFSDPDRRPLVITTEDADPARRRALEAVAEVVACGRDTVDLPSALRWLHARGARWVLCEGGPTLNGTLLAAGLVDELFLTLAPLLVGGGAGRIAAGPALGPVRLQLKELREYQGELLARYAVVR
jgi:riboflavin-specific deaminase-like protein